MLILNINNRRRDPPGPHEIEYALDVLRKVKLFCVARPCAFLDFTELPNLIHITMHYLWRNNWSWIFFFVTFVKQQAAEKKK